MTDLDALAMRCEGAFYPDDPDEEIFARMSDDTRLLQVQEQMERLEKICEASAHCNTPEGPAVKAIVYNSMLSCINEAAFLAYAFRAFRPYVEAALRAQAAISKEREHG